MTYRETVDYIFNSAPLFQHVGADAYKEGLTCTRLLDAHFGHPHRSYKTIHVAGTNGKGSVSHTLAAILQCAGLRVGLYTSPHLVDFRERIRVNGKMIPEQRVIDFVEHERAFFEPLHPSFFELVTALAFKYFEEQHVDIAVVEVGLGGRLDCTNIITPILSIITNISLDHVQFLGDTVTKIATEKAGIIKPGVPAIIGECLSQPDVCQVFMDRAADLHAPLHFAERGDEIISAEQYPDGWHLTTRHYGCIRTVLAGFCQLANARTILTAVPFLPIQHIDASLLASAFEGVCQMTGLMGRWQVMQQAPKIICDTGHNVGGWEYLSRQLAEIPNLHIIIGMVSDKDITHVLALLPRHARYHFTAASVQRALPAADFAALAAEQGLVGDTYPDVPTAVRAVLQSITPDATIFIGGSTFIVADYLANRSLFCTLDKAQ